MRCAVLLAVLVSAVTAVQAGASTQANSRISPGVGIGKLRLGMTETEVRRTMGRPWAVVRRPAGFGLGSVEYQYDLAAYTARFVGAPGRRRAVRITTVLGRERTAEGIGPGSLERDLRRAYPQVRCSRLLVAPRESNLHDYENGRECTLTAPTGRRTIFRTSVSLQPRERVTIAKFARRARVDEVIVASSGT